MSQLVRALRLRQMRDFFLKSAKWQISDFNPYSSHIILFFCLLLFFLLVKTFLRARVAAPKEREREKSAAGESARTYTHTRLYNNNKRPSCLKEREREYRVRVLRACCRYTRRIITTTTTRGRLKAIFIPSRPQKQGSEKERERERDEELFPRESCYSFRWWWW